MRLHVPLSGAAGRPKGPFIKGGKGKDLELQLDDEFDSVRT